MGHRGRRPLQWVQSFISCLLYTYMPERFLVFIPAYNCEKQVPRVLNQLLDRQVAAMVTECIVVNNRPTDGTEAAVQSWIQAHRCV